MFNLLERREFIAWVTNCYFKLFTEVQSNYFKSYFWKLICPFNITVSVILTTLKLLALLKSFMKVMKTWSIWELCKKRHEKALSCHLTREIVFFPRSRLCVSTRVPIYERVPRPHRSDIIAKKKQTAPTFVSTQTLHLTIPRYRSTNENQS